MEAREQLSSKEFGRNGDVQIQDDIFRQVAIEKTRKSISGDDHQMCSNRPLAKLNFESLEFKVVDACNQIKSESESSSPISVTLCQNPKYL